MFGIPLLYAYVFAAWALLIGLMALVVERPELAEARRCSQAWVIVLASFAYLGLLFAIAYYGDKRADAGRSIIANPYIYACRSRSTARRGRSTAASGARRASGIGFLPIYLGPTLMVALWWFVMRKIIRISKENRITSIADFIASRYGKSALLGGLVTVIAVIGIMPYISLQLKAISNSFSIVLQYPEIVMPDKQSRAAVPAATTRSTSR